MLLIHLCKTLTDFFFIYVHSRTTFKAADIVTDHSYIPPGGGVVTAPDYKSAGLCLIPVISMQPINSLGFSINGYLGKLA